MLTERFMSGWSGSHLMRLKPNIENPGKPESNLLPAPSHPPSKGGPNTAKGRRYVDTNTRRKRGAQCALRERRIRHENSLPPSLRGEKGVVNRAQIRESGGAIFDLDVGERPGDVQA
jgi:hypothetical protein